MFNISSSYCTEQSVVTVKRALHAGDLRSEVPVGCCVLGRPFPCASFENFIDNKGGNENPVEKLENAIKELNFTAKNSDLFTFNQSEDIVNLSNDKSESARILLSFRNFLLTDVRPWFEKITGITLEKDTVDLTSSIYNKSDVLLCHDDELEGRRIAFILYLVPPEWDEEKEGGCLQLFSDSSHESEPDLHYPHSAVFPDKIATSLVPKRNSLAFFEVSAYSFHQVAEVLGDRSRISIHGWFHGKSLPRPKEKYSPLNIQRLSPVFIEEELVYKWINKMYLSTEIQSQVSTNFLENQEIQLAKFLNNDVWTQLTSELRSMAVEKWTTLGPYNRRHFDVLPASLDESSDDCLPDTASQFQRLLASEALQLVIANLTGLPLFVIEMDDDDCDDEGTVGEGEVVGGDSEPRAKRSREEDNVNGEEEDGECDDKTTLTFGKISPPDIRRWEPGSYTLLVDADLQEQTKPRLELVYQIDGYGDSGQWQSEWGGEVVFCRENTREALTTITPGDNTLNLVLAQAKTASFVKYLNHGAKFSQGNQSAHDVAMTMSLAADLETDSDD